MSIFNHFSNLSLNQDQQAAINKINTFLKGKSDIFILQGYAGSGKTTLLKGVTEYLSAQKIETLLMAPTGRAAKILREKVGEANTIHKSIYNLSAIELLDDEEDAGKKIHYKFPLDESPVNSILIIDESSMISSNKSNHELFTFGTGVLLDDILTFSKLPVSGNKIIFVGDPAQLSPVGDKNSFALEAEYFMGKGFKVDTASLRTVMRQENNSILKNATSIRKVLDARKRSKIELTYDEQSFIKCQNVEIAQKYVENNPVPEIGGAVVISYSNQQSLSYNQAIRERLYPGRKSTIPGDLLLICNNNYHSYKSELMNGDLAKVMEVENELISRRNIPVFDTVAGKKVKKYIDLSFRKIVIRLDNFPEEISCYIIDSLLNSPQRDLSLLEMKALYIDFVIRFNKEQESQRKLGKPYYKERSEEFKQQLKSDPYYNALKVKYGYAITCHKAQGGEWDTIFVDYLGRNSLKNDSLRWSYTATTRARKTCFAANAPNLNEFSGFQISSVTSLKNIPGEYFNLSQMALSPYHSEDAHKAKSLKYWEIADKLENTLFQIKNVETNQYLERYIINYEEEEIKADGIHNGAGIFNQFNIQNPTYENYETNLVEILNAHHQSLFNISYSPAMDSLSRLYSLVQAACDECGVTITNVVEKKESYLVSYYLKTNAKAAMIQFYWNKNEQITRAIPKSTDGANDEKLNELIAEIVKLTYQPSEV